MFKTKLFSLIILLTLFLSFAGDIRAAGLSVRLSEPKTPTNQDTFDLIFVALDLNNKPVTVQCFKQGPSDGGFIQFVSDIVLDAGGNTGACPISSSILNTAGTYRFYVKAISDSGTVNSSIVTVDFNSKGPDAPTNYSKERPFDCTYRIKFRTANDGKTIRVDLYRSENTSFNADDSTKVNSLSIGPNTDGQMDNVFVDCTKNYYYAIRAFDTYGNGSGVTGDSETHVTTKEIAGATTETAGAITIGNAGLMPEIEESVLGTKAGEEKTETKEKAVGKEALGVATNVISSAWQNTVIRWIVIVAIAVIILVLLYVFFFKKNKGKKA